LQVAESGGIGAIDAARLPLLARPSPGWASSGLSIAGNTARFS